MLREGTCHDDAMVNGRAGSGAKVCVFPCAYTFQNVKWPSFIEHSNVARVISLILVTPFEVEIFIVLISQMKKLTRGVLLSPTYSISRMEFAYISVIRVGDESRKHMTGQNWNPIHKFLLNHSSSWSLYFP